WAGVFAVSFRVLGYFRSIEELGDILAYKLLSMLMLTAFGLLVFSGILTALSKLYLSKDLPLVHSMPVEKYKVFFARWIDSAVESSWMVVIYTLPVLISYGIVYRADAFFYFIVCASLASLAAISSTISAILVMAAVIVVPASRVKSIVIFLGLLVFVALYVAFRMLKPELLVDPEVFETVLTYIHALRTPSSPYLPSTWVFDSVKAALANEAGASLFHLGLAVTGAGALLFAAAAAADAIYFKGFSKTQTASFRLIRYAHTGRRLTDFLPRPVNAFVIKEIKTFFRDQAQWTQLFLLSALVGIYLYNFSVLPLEKSPIETVYLQNLLSFLNMGLALFVLTAVAARFAFPAVSIESNVFWLVRSCPISLKSFLRIKFFIYYLPLLVLTEILIVATNLLLHVTPFMMILSTLTVFFLVPGIVAMGIGLGAAFPDFKAENPIQTVTGLGGLLFMILSAALIGIVIALEAGPVYSLFMADLKERAISGPEWAWIFGSFAAVLLLSVLAIFIPLRFGEKRLAERMV
ncbi:MAG: hypothetical protein GY859_14925, partial [Desulfobacterales bacterium]|nr:hypothetical protein [Desulfobacterales bacterium]